MTEGGVCLVQIPVKEHTHLPEDSQYDLRIKSQHFSSSKCTLEPKEPNSLFWLILLLPSCSPHLLAPWILQPVSESTADQLQPFLLLNSLTNSMAPADGFAFKPTGSLWTDLNFFVLSIPGATTRAVKIREAAKTQPREQHPPCLVVGFLPWGIFLHFTGDSR